MLKFDFVFPFKPLGEFSLPINGSEHFFKVDICEHGARFRVTAEVAIDVNGQTIHRTRIFYFGEGGWLSLPTIEEAVLEVLGGTEEDVEAVSQKYDDLLDFNMPEFLAMDQTKGFVKQEYLRLNSNE